MSAAAKTTTDAMLRIGILASGAGTNFDAIAVAITERRLDAEARILICNRPDAAVLDKAAAHAVPATVVEHSSYPSREAFDREIVRLLEGAGVELVVMAGFDRVVTPVLLRAFANRVLNIHPALLPAFKGLDAQSQAADYGVRIAGATVHLVDEEVDHGPIIIQAAVAVSCDDDAEALRRRILVEEHRIYPYAIQLFAEGRIDVAGRRVRVRGLATPADAALHNPPLPG